MTAFQMVVPRVWSLNVPAVNRYIETKFADEFFENGSLRLSTFPHYTAIEDASRRDEREGQANFQFTRSGLRIAGWQNVGKRSYVMCTSTSEAPVLMTLFNCDNYIRIANVLAFADAVSRYIPGFIGGHIGPCIYRTSREITRSTKLQFGVDTFAKAFADGVTDENALGAATEQSRAQMSADLHAEIQFEHFFLKEHTFSNQSEFRIVWNVAHDAEEYLHVKCPEAIAFCSPGIETERMRTHRYKESPNSNGVVLMAGSFGDVLPTTEQEPSEETSNDENEQRDAHQ